MVKFTIKGSNTKLRRGDGYLYVYLFLYRFYRFSPGEQENNFTWL